MDPQLFIVFLVPALVLAIALALAAAAVLGAYLYRAGGLRSSPVPHLPTRGGSPAAAGGGDEDPRPYHRRPPKP